MRAFNVNTSEQALKDLSGIAHYLSKFSIETAEKYHELIIEKMSSLVTFPTRCPFVRNSVLCEKGYRWTYVRNYTIFFKIYEEKNLVVVERILYSRRAYDFLL